MKLRIAAFLVLIPCLSFSLAFSQMTGRQVMEEQKKRHDVKSELTVDIMLLVDRNNKQEQRTMKTYHKDLGGGENRSLVVFEEPAKVKGTAMLTWEHNEADDDQWLYLPSQKKMRRIAAASKKSYFMGTDLTYEDMESEDIDEYNYTMLDPEAVDGQDCYVLEAVPVDQAKLRASGYSKRKLWVRQDIFYTVKIEFFDQRGRQIKTQTNLELEQAKGTAWRAKKSMVDNITRKHKTLTAVKSQQIGVKLDDAIFTERYILSERHIQ
ncbi:outer membrane lipoprotein-sorting protein [candidate division KSB1 bacterium]